MYKISCRASSLLGFDRSPPASNSGSLLRAPDSSAASCSDASMNRDPGRGRNLDNSEHYTPRGRGRGRARGRGRREQGRGQGGGRYSRTDGSYPHHRGPVGVDGTSSNVYAGSKDGLCSLVWGNSGQMSASSVSKQYRQVSTSNHPYQQASPLPSTEDITSEVRKLNLVETSPSEVVHSSKPLEHLSASVSVSTSAPASERELPFLSSSNSKDKDPNIWRYQRQQISSSRQGSNRYDCSPAPKNVNMQHEISLLKEPDIKHSLFSKGSQYEQTSDEKTADATQSKNSPSQPVVFDICPVPERNVITLKPPLLVQNRIKRDELKRSAEGHDISVLRSGMLLLKRYIKLNDQIKLVKLCRDLGVGSGGFYEPGYRDGGKLHLKMMCLGKNWDPESSAYGDERPTDGAKPPLIPAEFCQLVKGAMQDSHFFLKEHLKMQDVERILPSVSPNICIVNFYAKSGKLGLHQDKDESHESLRRQLPVVSFSIGDSAEFAYGDQRDTDSAETVTLESGDVLIFGGKSRLVFHGVTNIISDTAPKALLEQANMRPGRLNLTFRQY